MEDVQAEMVGFRAHPNDKLKDSPGSTWCSRIL